MAIAIMCILFSSGFTSPSIATTDAPVIVSASYTQQAGVAAQVARRQPSNARHIQLTSN